MDGKKKWIWHRDELNLDAINSLQSDTMSEFLGVQFTGFDSDRLTATMPVNQRTIQPFGRLHGGASLVLAETVGSVAANLVLDTEKNVAVGLEINANHIRPVRSGLVTACAVAEAIGRTTQIWTIRIKDERDRLVCLSRFTVAVIPVSQA